MSDIIRELELSVRASNVLRNSGLVETIEDFMALTKEQVMALPNAGVRTWKEIAAVQENILLDPLVESAYVSPAQARAKHSGEINFSYVNPGREALRDMAALAALPAIIQVCAGNGPREIGTETFEQMFARKAWAVADAFIAAREGKTDDV